LDNHDDQGRHHGQGSFQALRSSHYMGLSLFLIMLAFFIGLTAMSDLSPERSATVVAGVQEAFSSADFVPNIAGIERPKDGLSRETGDLPEQQLKAMLGRTLGDMRLEDNADGKGDAALTAYVPEAVFDNYVAPLAQKISEMVKQGALTTVFGVEIILPLPAQGNGGNAASAESLNAFYARIRRYAALFEKAGFPAHLLAFGGQKTDLNGTRQANVEIRFIFETTLKLDSGSDQPLNRQAPIIPALPNTTQGANPQNGGAE